MRCPPPATGNRRTRGGRGRGRGDRAPARWALVGREAPLAVAGRRSPASTRTSPRRACAPREAPAPSRARPRDAVGVEPDDPRVTQQRQRDDLPPDGRRVGRARERTVLIATGGPPRMSRPRKMMPMPPSAIRSTTGRGRSASASTARRDGGSVGTKRPTDTPRASSNDDAGRSPPAPPGPDVTNVNEQFVRSCSTGCSDAAVRRPLAGATFAGGHERLL